MGAWAQAITQGLGRVGSEAGDATDHNVQTALEVIQKKLMTQELQQRVRESEMRTKQMGMPQPQGVMQTSAGGVGTTFDPNTGQYSAQPLPGIPPAIAKTLDQQWLESSTAENKGKPPSAKEIEAHQSLSKNPVNAILAQAMAAQEAGDLPAAQNLFKLASTIRGVQKGPTNPSVMSLVMAANQGDPQAQSGLKTWLSMQKEIAESRGESFGKGRAMYNIQAYEDPSTGQIIPMSALDALAAVHAGQNLIPSGRLPAQTAIAAQQLTSEAKPALNGVRRYLGAFDNAGDRAIFARILSNNPAASPGQEKEWLGTILSQAATSSLSPDGKHLVVQLNRLNESVGRLRSVLGLPATQSMTAMTLAMVPGPTTPDSQFATEMLDNLDQTIGNAVSIPALGGAGGMAPGAPAGGPPPGSKILTYDPATGTVK